MSEATGDNGAVAETQIAPKQPDHIGVYLKAEYDIEFKDEKDEKLGVLQWQAYPNHTNVVLTDYRKFSIPNERLTSAAAARKIKKSEYRYEKRSRERLVTMGQRTALQNASSLGKSEIVEHLDRLKAAREALDPLA